MLKEREFLKNEDKEKREMKKKNFKKKRKKLWKERRI